MFKIFPNKKIKILTIFLAIIGSWGFLIFAIYDAGHPTEGVTGALIQVLNSNPELQKDFSSFSNPPMYYEASSSATPNASLSATPQN